MSHSKIQLDIAAKWNQRHQLRDMPGPACRVLLEHRHLLPASGQALDVACGLGGNAVLLAEAGLCCDALDISEVAVTRLNAYAQGRELAIAAQLADVEKIGFEFNPNQYDIIVVSYFLHRPLFPALAAALKPGGLLFYQTFVKASNVALSGPRNSDFYLHEKELPSQFHDLEIQYYVEAANAKNNTSNVAELVARKPSTANTR